MGAGVIPPRPAAPSSHSRSRIIGAVYLVYFVTAVLGALLLRGLVVAGDAATTATNIQEHETLYRLGFAVGLIATALYVAVTALFYGLCRPVNPRLSLLAAFFSLVGCAIQAGASLFQLAPLVILGSGNPLQAFPSNQVQALALFFVTLYSSALNVALVFFGLYDLLTGYLIVRSTFLPRALGVLMVLAGVGWLLFLAPPIAYAVAPVIEALGFIAEVALMLWLLVVGVKEQRWQDAANTAQEVRE